MSNLLESYRVLGVKVGAGMADVTTSYRQLCRTYHPDITDDPEAEEQMKKINIAYTVLRDKFKRESAFRDRQTFARPVKRYPSADAGRQAADKQRQADDAQRQAREAQERKAAAEAQRQAKEDQERRAAERAAASADAEKLAYCALHEYFDALNACDYSKAYNCLSNHDKRHINQEGFKKWRESVARLYPMREFKIASGSSIAVVTWGDNKSYHARKFRVAITEDDYKDDAALSGDIDKLVINENGKWGVFLGYKEISQLTRSFEKRFETKKKRDVEKILEVYAAGLHPEYNMLNLDGLRKTVSKELYRLRRYGGAMTFAALSIRHNGITSVGSDDLLRSAAKTICSELRETDVPAYTGDGVFAIMFVELGKKNAENVIRKLIESIRKNAGPHLGEKAEIVYEYGSWSGTGYADMDMLNSIMKIFSKKI